MNSLSRAVTMGGHALVGLSEPFCGWPVPWYILKVAFQISGKIDNFIKLAIQLRGKKTQIMQKKKKGILKV